jgi:hypothetical protein
MFWLVADAGFLHTQDFQTRMQDLKSKCVLNTMGWNTADRPNGVVFLLAVYCFDICSEHGTASRFEWLEFFLRVGGGPAFGFWLGTGLFQVSVILLFLLAESGLYINLGATASELALIFLSSRIISSPLPRMTSIGLAFPYDGDCVCCLLRPLLKHLHSASDAVSLHGTSESTCHI